MGNPSNDRILGEIASRQQGLVTRRQMLAAAFAAAVERRLRTGNLVAVHGGVYLVGHTAETLRTKDMTAVLACGDESVPATTPARTVLDLAAVVDAGELESAVAEAHARGLARERQLRDQLDRNRGRPGAGALRALLDKAADPALTHSEAERLLLRLVRRSPMPHPAVNVRIGQFKVDFLWHEQRLIVEVDGFAFHSGHTAFQRDRRRGAELTAMGLLRDAGHLAPAR